MHAGPPEGHSFHYPESDYRAFESRFPFEETEDQAARSTRY